MSLPDYLQIVPGHSFLSLLIWAVIVIVLLYFARTSAHRSIRGVCQVMRNAMRFASRSILSAEKRLASRNREVLLADGMAAIEREVEREFHRVGVVVERDLQGYPSLNRKLSEQIANIDEDYRQSDEVPPTPPIWVNAVDAVAKIPDKGNQMVSEILKDIHKTIIKIQKEAMEEYWKATNKRHELLKKMMPYWRRLAKTLSVVDKTMNGFQERAMVIDNRMQEYEEIQKGTNKAVRKLSSSSMTQFFISGLVLLIAIGGAVINFNLIALPMSEMVGGGSYIAGFKTSNVAGMVIVLLETALGIFLMDLLRVTKLFPIVGSIDDKLRLRITWAAFIFLFILACIESSLAFMRDIIAANNQALIQSLSGAEEGYGAYSTIPTIGQMAMGFILPFILTFVAWPLESFIHSARTMLGYGLEGFLRFIAVTLRLIGIFFYYLGSALVGLYDLLIFPPLWVEDTIKGKARESVEHPEKTEESPSLAINDSAMDLDDTQVTNPM